MRITQYCLPTLKENPNDAETISHQLMLRAGMIRKVAAGIYNWLPLGLRVLRRVESIVREEMNAVGALEMLMPAAQPAELWQETDRWDNFGGVLLKWKDRNQRDFCTGPTHEEVFCDFVRNEFHSYKQLPALFYQIQTKFRDEARPRSGVMRSREFIMKDAYSVHLNDASLAETYETMSQVYHRIFQRLGLHYCAVDADSGSIGGSFSCEFQVIADSGEDRLAITENGSYSANIECAKTLPQEILQGSGKAMELIETPGLTTIKMLFEHQNIPSTESVKTLIVKGSNVPLVALILRGDHELNPLKAEKLPSIASPLTFAEETEVIAALGAPFGSLGPVNVSIPVIVDYAAAALNDFTCGANQEGKHFTHVHWERDLPLGEAADLRFVIEGDPAPEGEGSLKLIRGIEVGHIFQLGDKYSQAMKANVLDELGQPTCLKMGCYGLGVSRVVAAAVEQHHDEKGIVWPESMAPFQIILIPINQHKSERLQNTVEKLYKDLTSAGFDVLLDDRKERPGVKFATADLIGIPHRLILSDKGLDANSIEYKARADEASQELALPEIIAWLSSRIALETSACLKF